MNQDENLNQQKARLFVAGQALTWTTVVLLVSLVVLPLLCCGVCFLGSAIGGSPDNYYQ